MAPAAFSLATWRLPSSRRGAIQGSRRSVSAAGISGSGERIFTLVFPAKEQSDQFVPRTACEIGLARMTEIQNDKSRSCALGWLSLE